MQFLDLTIYLRGRWFRHRLWGADSPPEVNPEADRLAELREKLRRGRDTTRKESTLAADVSACLLALDPGADPPPRVLQVEFPNGYRSYAYDENNRQHFEDFMDWCRVLVLLPTSCDLLGLEERLRPHLAERYLHISERSTVAGDLARYRCVLKAGEAWLHSPAQAEELTGVALPVHSWFGPSEQR